MGLGLSLDALNFALAGAREGFGPFLGVYLQHQGFDPALTGFAMSLAGIAGILATGPLGAVIDRLTAKRAGMVAAVAAIALGAVLIVITRNLWLVAIGQVFIGVADAALAPLVAALTLGLVGQDRYPDRVSRNEAFNHGGNAANAAVAALLGYWLGLGMVAVAIFVMAVATSLVLSRIDPERIDHVAARGGEPDESSTLQVLWTNKPLLLLGACTFLFQAANGAMLPFLAQSLTKAGRDPSLTTGAMTVLAQVTMVAAALAVPRLSRDKGHGMLLGAALGLVIARAGLAAGSQDLWAIGLVQVMEGAAMGLAGVAIPALVAGYMDRSGHASAGLGGVMMLYGAGAAVSPLVAGLVAQHLGFAASFIALGLISAIGLALWIGGSLALRRRAAADEPESAARRTAAQ